MNDESFINVEKIVDQLEIKPDMGVADFGAGHGFFSVAFAKRVGSSGQVFAIDIVPSALEAIRSSARLAGLFNIKVVMGDLEKTGGSGLSDESCDLVFIANMLFQASDKRAAINEARRILKKDGRLAVIEWKPYVGLGPKKEHRLSDREIKDLALAAGFGNSEPINVGSHHYGLVFKK